MFYQFPPALRVYKKLSGIIRDPVRAVTASTGRYCQCTQLTPLFLQGARFQAFFKVAYRLVNRLAWIIPPVFLMATGTGFTQGIHAFLKVG